MWNSMVMALKTIIIWWTSMVLKGNRTYSPSTRLTWHVITPTAFPWPPLGLEPLVPLWTSPLWALSSSQPLHLPPNSMCLSMASRLAVDKALTVVMSLMQLKCLKSLPFLFQALLSPSLSTTLTQPSLLPLQIWLYTMLIPFALLLLSAATLSPALWQPTLTIPTRLWLVSTGQWSTIKT